MLIHILKRKEFYLMENLPIIFSPRMLESLLKQFFNFFALFSTHFLFIFLREYFRLNNLTATLILSFFFHEFWYFFPAIIFELMDREILVSKEFKGKYKLKEINSKYKFGEMVPTVLLNHVLQYIVFCILVVYNTRETTESWTHTLMWSVIFFLVTDWTLFFGHYFMHLNETIYKFTHSLHHSTFGSQAVSAHFMTIIDFTLESVVPMVVSILFFKYGASGVALLSFACAGALNTTVVHSGYELPFLSSPKQHYLHHLKYNYNFSIGITDYLFQTNTEELIQTHESKSNI